MAPEPVEIQEDIIYPHFILSAPILQQAGLVDENHAAMSTFSHYRFAFYSWAKVSIEHVVDLKSAPKIDGVPVILLKAPQVVRCPNIDNVLGLCKASSGPHNTALATRRNELAQRLNMLEVQALRSSVPPSQASSIRRSLSRTVSPAPSYISPLPAQPPSPIQPSPAPPSPHLNPASPLPPRFTASPSPSYEITGPVIKSEPIDVAPSLADGEIIEILSSDDDSDGPVLRSHRRPPIIIIDHDTETEPALSRKRLRKTTPPLAIDVGSAKVTKKQWPRDFHVVDIVKCIEMCAAEKTKSKSSRIKGDLNAFCFASCFPDVTYKPTTFNDNRRRWFEATQQIRDEALAAGHTDAGLWSAFAKKQPAHDAILRAERKRVRRHQDRVKEEDKDEIV